MKKALIIALLLFGTIACNRIKKEERVLIQGIGDATLVIPIPKAGCKKCQKILEEGLQNEIGVQQSILDLNSKNLSVVYNPDSTTPDILETTAKKLATTIPCK